MLLPLRSLLHSAVVEVPDVVGAPQAAAIVTLEAFGFEVEIETAYSSDVEAGFVISQDPEAGETAAIGATVTIVVSLGSRIAKTVISLAVARTIISVSG